MAKADFSSIAVVQVAPERCVFESNAGEVIMNLRPLNDRQMGAMYARRDELVTRYVTGGWTSKDAKGEDKYNEKPDVYILPGETFPLQGGLDERTLFKIARVEAMQVGREADCYTFDDLVPMIEKSEQTWQSILIKCAEIQGGYVPGKAWPVPSDDVTTIS